MIKIILSSANLGPEADEAFFDRWAAWVAEHVRVLAGLELQSGLVGDRHSEAVAAWRRFLEALADREKAPRNRRDLDETVLRLRRRRGQPVAESGG